VIIPQGIANRLLLQTEGILFIVSTPAGINVYVQHLKQQIMI